MQSERAQADEHRPARFADALSIPEFRSLYAASVLSWIGDYIARAAVTALVFQETGSVLWSAAAFAITYAPYLLGGPLLVAIAERYPYRRVMVACDLARMLLMGAVALLDDLPLGLVLGLLLLSALFAPPFDAARSATLPAILTGDRYVVGVALVSATSQPVQVVGYLTGAAIATGNPQLAILVNAITFGASALFVRLGVSWRPGALTPDRRTHLVRETADGFRLVFGTPVLRGITLVVFCGSLFAIVPEGLGAAWAHALAPDDPGLTQGWIMAAVPLGAIVGALTISRLVPPATRRRLFKPLAVAGPLALVPTLLNPPAEVVAVLAGVCGFAVGGFFPLANAEFVRHLPTDFRARAFGVVQGGLQLLQGAAVLATGLLARYLPVSTAVGLWSLGGTVLMLLLVRTGPAAAPVMPAPRPPGDGPPPGTMDT